MEERGGSDGTLCCFSLKLIACLYVGCRAETLACKFGNTFSNPPKMDIKQSLFSGFLSLSVDQITLGF